MITERSPEAFTGLHFFNPPGDTPYSCPIGIGGSPINGRAEFLPSIKPKEDFSTLLNRKDVMPPPC
jgi:hypothetical protein